MGCGAPTGWLKGEVAETKRLAVGQDRGEVWRALCIETERCPTGQIKRGGNKMAKKTLKKSKKLEATKPLIKLVGTGR